MDPPAELTALQVRKKDLLVESEINRQILCLECEQVRYRVESWRSRILRAQNVWKWAAPLAGFFFARKFSKTAGAFTAASGWLPLARKAWEAWRSRRRSSADR